MVLAAVGSFQFMRECDRRRRPGRGALVRVGQFPRSRVESRGIQRDSTWNWTRCSFIWGGNFKISEGGTWAIWVCLWNANFGASLKLWLTHFVLKFSCDRFCLGDWWFFSFILGFIFEFSIWGFQVYLSSFGVFYFRRRFRVFYYPRRYRVYYFKDRGLKRVLILDVFLLRRTVNLRLAPKSR